jgi:uncharacterized membrane protein YciS (DUF1049 family)
MRVLCLLTLVIIVGVGVVFGLENRQSVTLTFYNREMTFPIWGVLGTVYVLGMLTGWSIVGLLKRSWEGATDFGNRQAQAR